MDTYSQQAKEARLKVLDLIFSAQTSHIGSNFSCIDILTVLFDKIDLDRDRFILSKGWAAASLYYFLWKKGRIAEEQLNSYCGNCYECGGTGSINNRDPFVYASGIGSSTAVFRPGGMFTCNTCNGSGLSEFIGLAEPILPDIPIAGGSMGLGFPMAVGLALSKKLKGEEGTIYVLMSDGELQIGTTLESALIAAQHKLDNLMVIVDGNNFQAMGKTNEILKIEYPQQIFQGWDTYIRMDGHNFFELERYFDFRVCPEIKRPRVWFCNTTKGKGVKRFEGNNLYHYKQLSEEEYLEAKKELNG